MPRPDALTVYEPSHPLIRLGKSHDGGYCMEDGIAYDHFLSGGISSENSFELAALERYPHLTCDAYDITSAPGGSHPRYHFHHGPLGYEGLDRCKNALVKIDIERNEWLWLPGLTDGMRANIAQLVIELHSPHVPEESGWSWEELERLNQTHVLVWAHGNNWDGITDIDGVKVPGTIEGTWVRRDLEPTTTKSSQPIPGVLDMPNDPSKPDHVIDWEPFVWRKQ